MKKALVVAPLPPPVGGIATWMSILKQYLDSGEWAQGWQVFHLDNAVRWRSPVALAPWRRLVGGSWQSLRDLARAALVLWRERPHLVHATTSAGPGSIRDLFLTVLTRLTGGRCILHYHVEFKPGWDLELALPAMRTAHQVLVLDRETEQLLRKRGLVSLARLDNFLDLRELPNSRPDESLPAQILYLGRVTRDKGVETLVRVCAGLENTELHLVGPVAKELKPLLERYQGQRLRLHGSLPRQAVLERLSRARVVALPSRTEGFPYSILEAMALGCPIIASEVGAVAEMLQLDGDRPCGLACGFGDEGRLERALRTLLDDDELRRRLGANGQSRVRALYSAETGLARLLEIWEQVSWN